MATRMFNVPEGLSDQLWSIADATARSHGFEFDSQTETQLRGLISAGVAKLAEDDRATDRPRVSKMIDDITRLVEMMVQHSPHREVSLVSPGNYALSAIDFKTIKGWFCPCYPFC
ncbi:MAG TPA: hypothetical protein VMD78_15195 [Candidatus Baltobacteraceae bacterium]|nr:hypothetical protein [Candidatus Baltobacteraceae bacterium]